MGTTMTSKYAKAHLSQLLPIATLPAQLNCHCDDLAKCTVNAAILDSTFIIGRLPLEHAALSIEGEKQTTDVSKGLHHHIGS